MANVDPPDGRPEKIGTIIGALVTAVVYAGYAWMMLKASGVL